MRIIFNAIIMLAELAAIAGVAWLGFHYPLIFAGLTFALSLALGIALEIARLKNEMPFYFDRPQDHNLGGYNFSQRWSDHRKPSSKPCSLASQHC